MAQLLCPKGHESTDPDFCSVCGTKLMPPSPPASECPECGAKREPAESVFCENCGYNFSTGARGETKPPPADWSAAVRIDPVLKAPESPEPPASFTPFAVPIEKDSTLIGRRSEKRAVFPEISLDHDDAVSHRHALIARSAGGTLTVRDLGSSNGTRINGADLTALTDTPVNDGDRIELGHWTVIVVTRGNNG
jgi:hypothetical protein